MAAIDLARSHIERCLQDVWDVDRVLPDADGDYCFRIGTASCYFGLDGAEPLLVKAVACAVMNVKKSAKLLDEINAINQRCRTAHLYWSNGNVLVEQSMFAETVDRSALFLAGQSVGHIADDVGQMIATVFGGRTPIEPDGRTD